MRAAFSWLLSLTLLLTVNAQGAQVRDRSVLLGSDILQLRKWKKSDLPTIVETNPSCEKRGCLATQSLQKLLVRPVPLPPRALSGGKNPGSVACSKILKGKVALAVNAKKGNDSLCVFKDRSWITCASLTNLLLAQKP